MIEIIRKSIKSIFSSTIPNQNVDYNDFNFFQFIESTRDSD